MRMQLLNSVGVGVGVGVGVRGSVIVLWLGSELRLKFYLLIYCATAKLHGAI